MPRTLRLLTFDWDERVIAPLVAVGHRWDVVFQRGLSGVEPWTRSQSLPASARLTTIENARKRASRGLYDAVVCHAPDDIAQIPAGCAPVVLAVHTTAHLARAVGSASTALDAPALASDAQVFSSDFIRATWDADGAVIPPAIDTSAFAPWIGGTAAVLAAGNLLRELPLVSGLASLSLATRGLPVTILGCNPMLGSHSRPRPAVFREAFHTHAVFLSAALYPYSDGAPLDLLHAMAAGMPVVSLAHPAGVVQHDVTGLVADTPAIARDHLLRLLKDRALASRLGAAARAWAAEHYAVAPFTARWDAMLHGAAAAKPTLARARVA